MSDAERFPYVASMTTPTPAGLIASVIATAICFVNRSCTARAQSVARVTAGAECRLQLTLQSTGEHLDDARQLGQAQYLLVRQVADRNLYRERRDESERSRFCALPPASSRPSLLPQSLISHEYPEPCSLCLCHMPSSVAERLIRRRRMPDAVAVRVTRTSCATHSSRGRETEREQERREGKGQARTLPMKGTK